MGLWKDKRGNAAREYAIKREYDMLSDDAKQVLLTLSVIDGSWDTELTHALGWDMERLVDALGELSRMFLMPAASVEEGRQKLTMNQNTKRLVQHSFAGTNALDRAKRLMGAVKGTLRISRQEEIQILEGLRRSDLNVRRLEYGEAQKVLQDLLIRFPGEASVYSRLGELHKRLVQFTDAREMFRRAFELKCKDPRMYREWVRLETDEEEWDEATLVAERGLQAFPLDVELIYWKGHSLHRIGREYCHGGDKQKGWDLCTQALNYLEKALELTSLTAGISRLRKQIFRALVLNAEALEDEVQVSRYLIAWDRDMPGDPIRKREYLRLRMRYPRYLPGL